MVFYTQTQKKCGLKLLGFQDWQQLKSTFFWGPQYTSNQVLESSWGLGEILISPNAPRVRQSALRFSGSALRFSLKNLT
ncbi:MAG: hypothetical protein LBS83_02825 [Holosporales bacterium]|nr:hypothetical protein [Holosporales bacterium]